MYRTSGKLISMYVLERNSSKRQLTTMLHSEVQKKSGKQYSMQTIETDFDEAITWRRYVGHQCVHDPAETAVTVLEVRMLTTTAGKTSWHNWQS